MTADAAERVRITPRPVARSLAQLLQDFGVHTHTLVRVELRLAMAEARDELAAGARRIVLLVAALVAVLWGAVLGTIAAVSALTRVVQPWLAFLIVAIGCALIAVVLLMMAARTSAATANDRLEEGTT